MMLLASISWIGLLVLVAGGCLIFRLAGGRRGEGRCGGLKLLGVAAIVAGIAVFWIRPGRQVHVDHPRPATITVIDNDVVVEHPRFGHGFAPVAQRTIRHDGVPKWVLITLGSGLVILGALLFGRGGTRPVALKAVTLLGIGAILFAVVTFLGQAPRRSVQSTADVNWVRVEKRDMPRVTEHKEHEEGEVRRRSRHSHAKRPTLRPERPTGNEVRPIEELPPRAGGIPVSAELERQASKAESKEKSPPEPAAEPTPAAPPVPAPEPEPASPPKPTVAPVEEPKPAEPAETEAQPNAAEAPAEPEPGGEAPQQPAPATPPAEAPKEEKAPEPQAPAKPVESPTAVEPTKPIEQPKAEPAKPVEQPKAEPAKPVEQEPAASESPNEVVMVGDEPRPDWVDALPGLRGGVYSMSVRSGRFATLPECQGELDRQIKSEADHYINKFLGEQAAALVDIPLSYLKNHVKKAEYAEVVHPEKLADLNLGPMFEIHARLEFDKQAQADFRRQWRNAEVVNRLWYTGGAAALVLALLATLYGYLKLDLRTGDAHKGRLQLAATLVALIAAAGVLLVRWAVPF